MLFIEARWSYHRRPLYDPWFFAATFDATSLKFVQDTVVQKRPAHLSRLSAATSLKVVRVRFEGIDRAGCFSQLLSLRDRWPGMTWVDDIIRIFRGRRLCPGDEIRVIRML